MHNYYKAGEWNVTCDVCGKKIKAGEAKHRWDGFVVCEDDWEERQPQDFVRARQDKISVPFTRPRPADVFTNITYEDTGNGAYCTIVSQQAIPSWGLPGCMIPNKNNLGIIGTSNNIYCTITGTQAIPSYGIPGCMIPNKNNLGI